MSLINRILSMCESYAYMRPIIINNVIDHLKYGATGELLCHNIRNEWLYSNVTSRDESVFQFCNIDQKKYSNDIPSLKDHFMNAKQFCNNQLPFSFADSRSICEQTSLNALKIGDKKYFSPKNYTRFKYIAFCIPEESQQFFYHWQRQRKIWWRKFSANPGRFSLTEILIDENGQESTEIRAEFPWGQETIETIRNISTKMFDNLDPLEQEMFIARVGKRKVLPHVVESETSLEKAFMVFLCDGYADLPYHSGRREIFRFHRKLAPYKITFAAPLSSEIDLHDIDWEKIHVANLTSYVEQLIKNY
ncbi:DNA polymerase subunit gamma-2, mitochondrial isoform X2 [Sipha flava]|uniref:DNA polymerase subunit gamma-2, mitochondrial isoform X2 n=1 Tax=Sipha flava TaxID=143950 RepID=A0A8B8G0X9_9HEMI|nr:DNA polymerase subunit gamma-2, mitochondrial isoform X2 [Sipha flava]